CAGLEGAQLSVGPRHRAKLAQQAAGLKLDTILAGLDILAATKARMRGSGHGRILMEMALVRLGRLDDLVSLSQLAQVLTQPGRPRARAAPPASPAPAEARTRPVLPPEAANKKVSPESEPGPPPPTPLTPESLPQVWQDILAQVGPMLASNLGKVESIAISG